ncbi:DNA-binding protein [Desulfurococcaceae archaeon MEX13E-LK6-19]|nr:DNA-binding protein [Desulfurococcaceae archaeon MEX13E-LK6-19]
MSYDEELEAIKQRKLMELQRRLQEEERRRQLRLQKEMLLRSILTPKARERLANLRLVKPELAEAIEDQLIALAQSRRINIPITDDVLKELLASIYEQTHRETRIRIKEK